MDLGKKIDHPTYYWCKKDVMHIDGNIKGPISTKIRELVSEYAYTFPHRIKFEVSRKIIQINEIR